MYALVMAAFFTNKNNFSPRQDFGSQNYSNCNFYIDINNIYACNLCAYCLVSFCRTMKVLILTTLAIAFLQLGWGRTLNKRTLGARQTIPDIPDFPDIPDIDLPDVPEIGDFLGT